MDVHWVHWRCGVDQACVCDGGLCLGLVCASACFFSEGLWLCVSLNECVVLLLCLSSVSGFECTETRGSTVFYGDPCHCPAVYGAGGQWKGCLAERYQIVSDGCGEGVAFGYGISSRWYRTELK